jgi:hypothetical protein
MANVNLDVAALIATGRAAGSLPLECRCAGRGMAFLFADDASAITAINLPVDVGWLASSHLTTYGGMRGAH